MRLEIHFSNGDFRAFPRVDKESVITLGDNSVAFKFGKSEQKHEAKVFLNKIDFVETMEDE